MPYSLKKYTQEEIREKCNQKARAYNKKNRKRIRLRNREYARVHRAEHTAYVFRTQYGITVEFYEAECLRLNNTCPICIKQTKLVVDHNHNSKKFRGLLCRKCNVAIGLLGDNFITVKRAMNYLAEVPCV